MNRFIQNILEPIGVPVYFVTNLDDVDEYIIFNVWSVPGLHADDKETQTNYTVQIDIFTRGNFLRIADEVKNRMEDAGFMRILEDPGDYIEEANLFRKTFRFSYTTNN